MMMTVTIKRENARLDFDRSKCLGYCVLKAIIASQIMYD